MGLWLRRRDGHPAFLQRVVIAESTQPFNENDSTYYHPLYPRSIATPGFRPTKVTADAAFDDWEVYQTCAEHSAIASIPSCAHGHALPDSESDGRPRCPKGWRMVAACPYDQTYGCRDQRFRYPLLYPTPTGQKCEHKQLDM